MRFKRQLVGRQVSLLSMLWMIPHGRDTITEKIVVLGAFYLKQIKTIIDINFIRMHQKNINDYIYWL